MAPVCFAASATVSKIGTLCAVLEELAALAGRDAGDDLGAVVERELGVARAEAAGDALDEDAGVGSNEDGHGSGAGRLEWWGGGVSGMHWIGGLVLVGLEARASGQSLAMPA